jgi:catechol 2,3-dioxygenase-like lactoylglutathione lyase family enzyme
MFGLLATVFLAFGSSHFVGQVSQPAPPPIRQIDHIMIRTGDPDKLYAFFTETLQLPVAWRMGTRGGVMSGGVGFGNVNVEAIQIPGQSDKASQARLVGFGFEPSPLRESLAALDRRGITYGVLRPVVGIGPNGSTQTLFTNVTLRQFSDTDGPADATIHIFLSEYSTAYVNLEERRARVSTELGASGGGPLGIDSVKEIIVGVNDIEAARTLWQKLLDPVPPSAPNTWQVGAGPAIRLVPAKDNAVQALVISVASLQRAKAFLRERGLLGLDSAQEATIDPSRFYGLNVRLVAKN